MHGRVDGRLDFYFEGFDHYVYTWLELGTKLVGISGGGGMAERIRSQRRSLCLMKKRREQE